MAQHWYFLKTRPLISVMRSSGPPRLSSASTQGLGGSLGTRTLSRCTCWTVWGRQ